MKVLVTGGTGFLGQSVVRRLSASGHAVLVATRTAYGTSMSNSLVVGEIGPTTEWETALRDVDAVVHLAAKVHVMRGAREAEYRSVNTDGTLQLARAAAKRGVRRFVFVSTIKVNGESTDGRPFRADNLPAPTDAYARSKLAAEQGLLAIEGIDPVIIRPPLVYGARVKGNLARLCRLAYWRFPAPFGAIKNRRDLVGVENLADLITLCVSHPAAGRQILMATDGTPISTPDLFRLIAVSMGRKPRILSVPVGLMRALAKPLGFAGEIDRLSESLEIDSSATRELLDWSPPVTLEAGIAAMAKVFAEGRA